MAKKMNRILIKPTYPASTLALIRKLSERELQSEVIEPLLRLQGFKNVRDNSGAGEHGSDLVAIKPEFGRTKLYAIQIKKWKLSGKIADNKSLGVVLAQLRQASKEPVIDPSTNRKRVADRVMFITPYKVSRHAFESALKQLQETEEKDITLIDGPLLASLIIEYMPDVIKRFSMTVQYRLLLAKSITEVKESSAFGLHYNIDLKDIYVDLGIILGGKHIVNLSQIKLNETTRKTVKIHGNEVEPIRLYIEARISKYGLAEHFQFARMPKAKAKDNVGKKKKLAKGNDWLFQVDVSPIVIDIRRHAKQLVDKIHNLSKGSTPIASYNEVADKCILFARKLDDIVSLPRAKKMWEPIRLCDCGEVDPLEISSQCLTVLEQPFYILGGPGSGKTTLMRMLCRHILENSENRIPLVWRQL